MKKNRIMGTYLATGIVRSMSIAKRSMNNNFDLRLDNVLVQLRKEVNLDYYSFSEDDEGYYWKINPSILEGNLVEFLEEQFLMYEDTKDPYLQEAIDKIKEAKTGEQIIQLAEDRSLSRFQLVDNLDAHMRVVSDKGFNTYVLVYYKLIAFFLDGKILMECWNNILRYFGRNIRLQREKYPIADCVKVMITQ